MSYNSPFTGNVVQPTDVSYRRIILTTDLQLAWPINGQSTDDAAARIMEVSTTTTANELWMPPANQASVGQDALIRNVGSVAITVKTFGGASTIVTINAGEASTSTLPPMQRLLALGELLLMVLALLEQMRLLLLVMD